MMFGDVWREAVTRVLAVALTAGFLACTTTGGAPPSLPELEEGDRLRGELEAGEVRVFALPARQEMFVHLFVDGESKDLKASVADASGEAVARFEFAPHGQYRQVLVTTLPADEGYRLRLESESPGPYRLVIQDLRPATPRDRARAPGLEKLYRARSLFINGLPREHYLAALNLLREAEADLTGVDPALRAYTVLQQANCWLFLQDTEQSLASARKARQLFERLREREGPAEKLPYQRWLAEAYGTEASALDELGRAAEALPLITAAVETYRHLGPSGRSGAATYLNIRGQIHSQLGDLDHASTDFQRALEIVKQDERLQPRRIVYLINLADLYRQQGRLRDSLRYFQEAEALAVVDPSVHARLRLQLNATLGRFYIATGDYAKARILLSAALKLARQRQDRRFETDVLRSLGLLRQILGDLETAETRYREALVVTRELDSATSTVGVLLDLGALLLERSDLEAADPVLREALDLAQRSDLGTLRARGLTLAARLAVAHADTASALNLSTRAVKLARQRAPTFLSQTLLNHGQTLLAAGLRPQAEATLGEALELTEGSGLPMHQMEILVSSARAARAAGDLEHAREALWRAVRIFEEVRGNLASPRAKTGFMAHHHELYGGLTTILAELHEQEPEAGWADRALEVSERSRARTLMEMISGDRRVAMNALDEDLAESERQQRDLLSLLYDQLQTEAWEEEGREAGGDRLRGLRRELGEAREVYAGIEGEIRRQHGGFAEIRYPEPLDVLAMAPLVPPGTALLLYSLGTERSALFVLREGEVTLHRLPAASDIRVRVEELLRILKQVDIRSKRGAQRLRRELYSLILAPAAIELEGTDRLYVVADGTLHFLPFEILEDERGRPLIETRELAYVPSVSVLASLQARPAEVWSNDFVAFADPVVEGTETGSSGQAQFQALPGTGEEVAGIAELFPGRATLYLGAAASEDNLYGNPIVSGARRLHFASHGIISEVEPMESGLLLSPDKDGDRYLQVAEIFGLELHSELVVLSACETGLGPEVRGEGILGLSKAFFFAGTRNVLVSLWPVSDRSTSRFMKEFYRGLARGETVAASLRNTKLRWIEENLPAQAWAPFILLGPIQHRRQVVTDAAAPPL